MLRVALVLGACGFGAACACGDDLKPGDDLAALQGNWTPLQCEYKGVPQVPPEKMKQITGVYDKDNYFLYFVDRSQGGTPDIQRTEFKITLEQNSNPKRITFEFLEGALKGVKRHGIYELAGNQLKLCLCSTDQPCPTEFKSTPANGCFLETWARKQR
jgi:uncharacterized protein (TIGR03067 family)